MNIRAKVYGSGDSSEPQPILQGKSPKGSKADALDSVAVEREVHRSGNNRFEDRHRLSDEQVRVSHAGREWNLELVNLSGGGAMVSGAFDPKLWDKVELHVGTNGMIECAVRWIRQRRIGLEFAHETRLDCPTDEQASLLREVISRSFPEIEFGLAPETTTSNVSDEDEQRRAARHPLIWSGVLHHDFQSTQVRIRNISRTGAMIESQVPVRVGTEPVLELGEAASVSATVEWVVGDQVGLKFHQEFDMGLLARAKPEVAPQHWVRPSYLDPSPDSDSPWAPQWERMSLTELKQELEGFLKR